MFCKMLIIFLQLGSCPWLCLHLLFIVVLFALFATDWRRGTVPLHFLFIFCLSNLFIYIPLCFYSILSQLLYSVSFFSAYCLDLFCLEVHSVTKRRLFLLLPLQNNLASCFFTPAPLSTLFMTFLKYSLPYWRQGWKAKRWSLSLPRKTVPTCYRR